MPLGKESLANLATCHVDLQDLIEHVAAGIDRGDLAWAKIRDIKVTCGYRGKVAQDAAVANGFSKAPWPTSKHNTTPSDAVDVVPYPELWSDEVKWRVLHAYIAGVARGIGLDLRHISWDMPHIERAL